MEAKERTMDTTVPAFVSLRGTSSRSRGMKPNIILPFDQEIAA